MDYIEWVEKVAMTFATMEKEFGNQAFMGRLSEALGLDDSHDAQEALWQAAEDLDRINVLEIHSSQVIENENTRKIRNRVPLDSAWPGFFDTFLEREQTEFLEALVSLAERTGQDFASARFVGADEIYAALGKEGDEHKLIRDAHTVTNILVGAGYALTSATVGSLSSLQVRPTYKGIVRATKYVQTESQERISGLLPEWETTTVEFKREIPLRRPKEKGEFVRDVLGLATTKASGDRRFLIIGFDPKTREFVQTVASDLTQDRMEHILNAHTEPTPEIHYQTVAWQGGAIGFLQVIRDPAKIPYRVTKDVPGSVQHGEVFVRHGTQVEKPTDAELAALIAEGKRARGEI